MKIHNGIKLIACSVLMQACTNSQKPERVMREIYPNGTVGRVLKELSLKSKIGLDSSYKILTSDTINIGPINKITVDNVLEKIKVYTEDKGFSIREDTSFKSVITSPRAYKNEDGDIYIPVEIYNKFLEK